MAYIGGKYKAEYLVLKEWYLLKGKVTCLQAHCMCSEITNECEPMGNAACMAISYHAFCRIHVCSHHKHPL